MSLRDQFPILQRKVNGYPLVYLDNAATTQKPQVVLDAMNGYYSQSNANVHRAVHTLAGEATEGYESCRTKLKQRFNASKAIITSGTTEAINLVAHAWGRANLRSGDAIVLTEMEHHSDIVPWQMLAQERGVELRYVPVTQLERPRRPQSARRHHCAISRCGCQGAHRCGTGRSAFDR
jgi:cysteine desulfurase/selenocysteine lyase